MLCSVTAPQAAGRALEKAELADSRRDCALHRETSEWPQERGPRCSHRLQSSEPKDKPEWSRLRDLRLGLREPCQHAMGWRACVHLQQRRNALLNSVASGCGPIAAYHLFVALWNDTRISPASVPASRCSGKSPLDKSHDLRRGPSQSVEPSRH
jgi:hypothetical protein